jgi:plastocyanin
MIMRRRVWLGAPLVLLAFGGISTAAAEPEAAVADLRREVADLRREISDLRREIYALRLDLLSAIGQLSGGKAAARAPEPAPVVKVDPTPEAPEPKGRDDDGGTGTVVGTVSMEGEGRVAYVYVENVPLRMVRGQSIDIKQSGRQFEPRAAVVQVGTKVNFPNLDSMYHNVFSLSPGNSFDLGIYRAGEPMRSYVMTNAGLVDVYCNMHSEMSASILVVPSRLYAAVGPDGRFVLNNVPRGNRKIAAWGPGHELSSKTVSVSPGKEAQLAFRLGKKSGLHTNKNGQPYGSYK